MNNELFIFITEIKQKYQREKFVRNDYKLWCLKKLTNLNGVITLSGEEKMIENNIENIYGEINTYNFKIGEHSFNSIEVPTSMFINRVSSIFKGYNLYPEMANNDSEKYSNELVLKELKNLGIYKIEITKNIFESTFKTAILDINPNNVFSVDKLERDSKFLGMKKINPFIGMFWLESQDGLIQELDWLPVPARKMVTMGSCHSINLCYDNDSVYLVIYKHADGILTIKQSLYIGKSSVFFNEFEIFAPQKLIEVLAMSHNAESLINAWDLFFVGRTQYFFGDHPYIDPLDPEEVTIQDKTRMFLIWLHRLQEFVGKLAEFHNQGKTILLTKKHNEMNGEYVSYNITYTPEIRNEVLAKKDSFQLYAIANDWFVKA